MADEPSREVPGRARPVDALDPAAHGFLGVASSLERTSVAETSIQMVRWQGHDPPPEAAERLERLAPSAFERMLPMAERAQASQLAAVSDVNRDVREEARRWRLRLIGQPWVADAFLGVRVLSVARSSIVSTRRR